MNRTAYYSYSNNEKPAAEKSRASRSVIRHQRVRRMQRRVAVGILGSTLLLVSFGMLLLVLPAFKVQSIKVKGNSRVAEESVIAASGVEIGDEILDLKKGEIAERIAQDENVERVSVKTSLGSVTIKIVEKEGTAVASSAEASAR